MRERGIMDEQIKVINKAMQAYSRQLAPILKILNSLAEEPLENGAVKGNPDAIPTPKKIKKDNA